MEPTVLHFYEADGKLFPALEVHQTITRIFEGITTEYINTSRTPKSFILRMTLLRRNVQLRARVWREAINDLVKRDLTVNPADIHGKFKVTKIDFAKIGLDNVS